MPGAPSAAAPRLEHHGKFGKIEAADIDQRAGAFFRSNRHCVGKSVADFAQTYGGEWRWQAPVPARGAFANGPSQAALFLTLPFNLEYL